MQQMAALLIALSSWGAQPGASEKLPPPSELPNPAPAVLVPHAVYRVSRYQAWQYLSVDGAGFFRPRVIQTSQEAYYLYDGMPYPTPTLRPWWYRPEVTGN